MTSAVVQKFTTTEGTLRKNYGKAFRTKSTETSHVIMLLFSYHMYYVIFLITFSFSEFIIKFPGKIFLRS